MYKRRVIIVLAVFVLALGGLLVRLLNLQVVHGEKCRRDFELSQHRFRLLPALRGQILDNHGEVLAREIACYEFCMEYGLLSGDEEWIASQTRSIQKARRLSKAEASRVFQEMSQRSWELAASVCGSRQECDLAADAIRQKVQKLIASRSEKPEEVLESHVLAGGLDEAQANPIKAHLEGTIGVSVRPAHKRWYPAGDLACHIIGVVRRIDPPELERVNRQTYDDELARRLCDYRADDMIGKFGVEKLCEEQLRGKRGYRQTSMEQEQPEVVPPQAGKDVRLSLDIELQKELADKFRQMRPGFNGCVVLLNVADSSVLAMVSLPTYDLNDYGARIAELSKDNYNFPLHNRGVVTLYAPGSTAKPIAALAGLTEGVITANTVSFCQGSLFGDPQKGFPCTGHHGDLSLVGAIQHSCNIYFYRVGERLERHRGGSLVDYFRKFGFCDRPGTGLAGEMAGDVKPPAGEGQIGAARFMAIGQSTIAVTPLHVANEMATIARGGVFMTPTVLADGSPRQGRNLGFAPEHLALVQRGMHEVTSEPGGTGYKNFREAALGFETCGKSGTAQSPKQWRYKTDRDGHYILDERGRRQIEILRDGNMVWFAGYAPYRNPQVAFAVVVEYVDWDESGGDAIHGGGATVSGPLAVEALRACKERGYIK